MDVFAQWDFCGMRELDFEPWPERGDDRRSVLTPDCEAFGRNLARTTSSIQYNSAIWRIISSALGEPSFSKGFTKQRRSGVQQQTNCHGLMSRATSVSALCDWQAPHCEATGPGIREGLQWMLLPPSGS